MMDNLCKQAKRIIKGKVDVLAKPLEDGIAICFFNKGKSSKSFKFNPDILAKDDYICAEKLESYDALQQLHKVFSSCEKKHCPSQ